MSYTTQVIFKIGEERYGFDIRLVNAIEDYEGIAPIPNAPSNILGMINLRGDIIPVFSLRKKFGMEEIPKDTRTQLIVTKVQDMSVGFKVDAVEEILEIEQDELHPMPVITRGEETNYADSVASKDKRLIILIKNEGVITNMEKQAAGRIIDDNA